MTDNRLPISGSHPNLDAAATPSRPRHEYVGIIAVDGGAGSGKGTLARALARAFDVPMLDTGAIYRAFALLVMRDGFTNRDCAREKINPEDVRDAALRILPSFGERLTYSWNGTNARVTLDGKDVSESLRGEAVGRMASIVSVLPEVRAALLPIQRGIAAQSPRGVVADGRDTTSVVFPDARVKLFLEASPELRAQRRHAELLSRARGGTEIPPTFDEVLEKILERDARDSNRAVGPLVAVQDAKILNVDGTADEVLQAAQTHIDALLANDPSGAEI